MRLPWKLVTLAGLVGAVSGLAAAERSRARRARQAHDEQARLQRHFGTVTSNGDQAARTSTSR